MQNRRRFLRNTMLGTAGCMATTVRGAPISVEHIALQPGVAIGDTLRAIIAKARPSKRIELVFAEGEHIIADTPASTDGPRGETFAAELVFDGFDEVVVRGEGQGAELLFSDFQRGAMRFLHCRNVVAQNLRIDWPRPPFSTGEVVRCDGADIEVRVDNDFPLEKRLAVVSVIRYDPETRAPSPVPDAVMYYHLPPGNTAFLGPQRLRITLPEPRDLPPGALLSLQHAQYGCDGLHFWHCDDVRLENVVVHTCPGMAFHGHSGGDLEMLRCQAAPSTRQRRRLHSSTADGSHFVNFSGRVTIDQCSFINTGDDCNNTWGTYQYVVERLGARALRITHQGTAFMYPQRIAAGDVLEFIGPDLAPVARIPIKEAAVETETSTYRVELSEDLPASVRQGSFLLNASRLPSLRIRHCRCANTRGRGFLVTTRDAVIEHCRFERLQNGGVLALPMMEPWFQAAGLDGLTARENTFEQCNHGIGPCWGEIMVGAIHDGWTHGAVGVNRNVRIVNNTIRDTGNLWLHLGSVDGAVVEGNRIDNGNAQEPHKDWMKAAVTLVNARNVVFRNNQFHWERGGDARYAFWDVKQGVDLGTIRLEDNTGIPSLPGR